MTDPGHLFIASCRQRLAELARRIGRVLERLDDDDLAWRPNEESNSIGNLVLHVAGNLRQRVVSALGGAPDTRDRDAEFNTRGPFRRAALREALDGAVQAADAVLAQLPPDRLGQPVRVRDAEQPVLEVLLGVVAHMAEHAGQIVYIAKMRLGPRWETLSVPHRRA